MNRVCFYCCFAVCAFSFAHSTSLASTISTTGGGNGPTEIFSFGETNTATYGQTFTVGSDNVMNNFTFWLNDNVNPDFIDFEAYVMAWDGSKASGPILFQSAALSTTNNGGNDGFEQFTINTGSLALDSGQQYVAFFSASNFFDGQFGTGRMGAVFGDTYSGGAFVFQNNGSNFGQLTTNAWSTNFGGLGRDAAFEASFSGVVPEPTSIALWSLGLAGMTLARRRRS